MKYFILMCIALFYCKSISGQDLLQRVKQETFIKNNTITNTNSVLAQKFIHANKNELPVISLFNAKQIDSQKRTAIDQSVSDAIVLNFNRKDLSSFISAKNSHPQFLLRIPVDDTRSFDLLLEESTALSETFELLTSDGEQIDYDAPGAFYNGIIDGIPESFATVSISEKGVEIIASDRSGNYILTEITGSESEYILFNDFKLKQKKDFVCDMNTENFVMPDYFDPNDNKDQFQLKVRDNVEVYVEVDYDLYADNNSNPNQTMDFVLDLFRASVSVFEQEQISLRLNRVFIWTVNGDPFNNITTQDDLKEQLEDWACIGFSDADIAHYISSSGGLRGRANSIGELCDQQDSGPICGNDFTSHCASLGMTTPFVAINQTASDQLGFTVPSWELDVFNHEMGHVFGSPHTHGCYWNGNDTQIDDCGNVGANDPEGGPCYDTANPNIPAIGGTVMSYCWINLSLGFGTQPGNLIRSVINNSSCIDDYEIACPEVETLENTITSNITYDAKKEVLIHDSSVANGFDPTFTGGERTIIYGNFQCAVGAGFNITLNGCN